MPLQILLYILLVPIVLHEIISIYKMSIPLSKRGMYKETTGFSLFVVVQLIFLVYEEQLLAHVFQFSIWILLFLFYGPFIHRMIVAQQQLTCTESKNYSVSECYYMIYVFIFGLFLSLIMDEKAYVQESLWGLLSIVFLYYVVLFRNKMKRVVATSVGTSSGCQTKRQVGLHLSLGIILVVCFYILSKEIKLTAFLFLLLVYVYLAFLRKNMVVQAFYTNVQQEELVVAIDGEGSSNVVPKEEQKHRPETRVLEYGQTKLNDVILQRCKVKVNQIIIENKAYLDANFKMTDLAMQTEISRYYLANYFNLVFKMNFREYINKLRIEHVVEYIHNHQAKEDLSVHDLFLVSAFNSKTSFFKSFKYVLGCTPFEYLKKSQY